MTKHKLTQRLIELLPEDHKITLEEAMLYWYSNIRNNGGFRLTQNGYQAMKILGLESWSVPLNDIKITMDKALLMALDRKLTYPYFIDYKKKEIVFYSSKEAMMATMYGSIKNWLDNMPQRRSVP
jgi:hypothetical protein